MAKKCRFLRLIFAGFLIGAFLFGCGSEEGQVNHTDDLGVRLDATLTVDDSGSRTVDVVQDVCDATAVPPTYEDFFDAFGDVSFTTESLSTLDVTHQNLYIYAYRVEYLPQPTPDGLGGTVIPPNLATVQFNKSIVLPPDGNVTDSIVLVSILTKSEFASSAFYQTYLQGNYSMKVTFFGEGEFGEYFELVVFVDALLADYDNC
ncbi:MAG: hypothetical protein ACWGN7_07570 [Thermodesulfovibrionales bacterium]